MTLKDGLNHLEQHPCRGTRHWMEPVGPPPNWNELKPYSWDGARHVIHYRCARCSTYHHQAIDHLGNILGNKYTHYPVGYRVDKNQMVPRMKIRLLFAKKGIDIKE